jgi:hypothetical protein
MRYRVEKYASDGHGGAPAEDYVIAEGIRTLEEARAVVREHMGLTRLTAARRWSGMDAVESYHDKLAWEAGADGCGGVAIVEEEGE